MAKTKKETLLEVPVSFGNVNIGDKSARIGVQVDRSELNLSEADRQLVEKRLTGSIHAGARGDNNGQGRLEGMTDDCDLHGTFDVKGIAVGGDALSFGLTFALGDIDVGELARFAKRTGRLSVGSSEDLPQSEKEEEE